MRSSLRIAGGPRVAGKRRSPLIGFPGGQIGLAGFFFRSTGSGDPWCQDLPARNEPAGGGCLSSGEPLKFRRFGPVWVGNSEPGWLDGDRKQNHTLVRWQGFAPGRMVPVPSKSEPWWLVAGSHYPQRGYRSQVCDFRNEVAQRLGEPVVRRRRQVAGQWIGRADCRWVDGTSAGNILEAWTPAQPVLEVPGRIDIGSRVACSDHSNPLRSYPPRQSVAGSCETCHCRSPA